MPPIIAIQFSPTGKQYHFDAQGITDLIPGDRVVVHTSRGRQLGIVTSYIPDEKLEGRICKPIERRATPRDLVMQQRWGAKALNALVTCNEKAEQLGLRGYKFAKAEYNFDGSQVTILYSTEKKADLGPLQRDLRRALRTKVELYQVGPRDLAKILDGLGACGVHRCCSRFLTRFSSVSIRMAKVQNISLTPSEITGVCGRLRCCLAYEHEQYAEAAEGLPRRGKDMVTPYGKGRVIEVRTLAGDIVVDVEGVRFVVHREDIGKKEFTTPPPDKKVDWPSWLPEERDSAGPMSKQDASPSRSSSAASSSSRRGRKRSRRPKKNQAGRPAESSESSAAKKPHSGSKSSYRRRSRSRRKKDQAE